MKLTSNQLQWQKELKRIKSFIKRAEKRGYTFKDYKMPEARPKRITKKMLQELKSETTPAKLYKQAEYKDSTTQETLSGYAGRKRERQKASKKAQRTRRVNKYKERTEEAPRISSTIYINLRESLRELATTEYKGARRNLRWADVMYAKKENAQSLLSLLDTKIAEEGESSVFQRLEENAEEIQNAISNMYLASTQEQVNASAVSIATVINGGSLSVQDSINYTDLTETLQGLDLV